MPISVIVPAYNEEAVIRRCLDALLEGAAPGELEIIVVCNGCTDRTAEVARSVVGPIVVLEEERRSKVRALNRGDEVASTFPRLYLDADCVVRVGSVRALVLALASGRAVAVAPEMRMDLSDASWCVGAFYAVWRRLPYTREGMIGVGSYALSEVGRSRFEHFPEVIADDGYVRLLYEPGERLSVPAAASVVTAPSTLADLVKIKTRSRLGGYQLSQRFPELVRREQEGKSYGGALSVVALRPWLWLQALVYLAVNLSARRRARQQLGDLDSYTWERDDSSR